MTPRNFTIHPEAVTILTKASKIFVPSDYERYLLHNRLFEIEIHHGKLFIIELMSYSELLHFYEDLSLFEDVHIVRVSIDRVTQIIYHEFKRFISKI